MSIIDLGFDKKPDVNYIWRECCYGVFIKNDEILLVYSSKDDNFSIPGGGMEKGETQEQSLKREFLEETGLTITRFEKLNDFISRGRKKNGDYVEQLSHIFLVDVDESSIQPPLEDWHEIRYIKKQDTIDIVGNRWQKVMFSEYLLNLINGE